MARETEKSLQWHFQRVDFVNMRQENIMSIKKIKLHEMGKTVEGRNMHREIIAVTFSNIVICTNTGCVMAHLRT